MDLKVCEWCNGSLDQRLSARGNRGRPTRFCSVKCKDDARNERERMARIAARPPRFCRECGGVIDAEKPATATTCSLKCSQTWGNRRLKEQAKAVRRSRRDPCAYCGGAIPPTRRAGVTYCSIECKKKAHGARWRERSPGYMRQYLYGVTPEQYADLLARQENRCAVCGTPNWGGKTGVPHVDHCHDSEKVRGLLCHDCNLMLGNARDDIARLNGAIAYLTLHQ